jgi:NADH-quinone oxidoreductase subunit C
VTPEELGERLVALAGDAASASVTFAELTVDVPRGSWVATVTAARDDPALDLSSFDWLSGVDELDDGFDVVLHVFSVRHRHRALLRTRVPRADPRLPSLVEVFPGAGWHERETHEMFGIGFDGHPHLVPLLLPDGFAGHPLRKDFVLAARVAKDWPGAKEPGESHTGVTRRRMRPPGVPDDWGPAAAAEPPERPARAERPAPGERPVRGERPARGDRPAEAADE